MSNKNEIWLSTRRPKYEEMKNVPFPRIKYGKTQHLPISPGVAKDDEVILCKEPNLWKIAALSIGDSGLPTIIKMTEKMDGENTSLYRNGFHARSLDSHNKHESRSFMAAFWAAISHRIPHNVRIIGENLYAKHSIHYKDLESCFQVFAVQEFVLENIKTDCDGIQHMYGYLYNHDWGDMKNFCNKLGLKTVPHIKSFFRYEEPNVSLQDCERIWEEYNSDLERESEGFILKIEDEATVTYPSWTKTDKETFYGTQLNLRTSKYVRKNHVQTDAHWFSQPVIKNELKSK